MRTCNPTVDVVGSKVRCFDLPEIEYEQCNSLSTNQRQRVELIRNDRSLKRRERLFLIKQIFEISMRERMLWYASGSEMVLAEVCAAGSICCVYCGCTVNNIIDFAYGICLDLGSIKPGSTEGIKIKLPDSTPGAVHLYKCLDEWENDLSIQYSENMVSRCIPYVIPYDYKLIGDVLK